MMLAVKSNGGGFSVRPRKAHAVDWRRLAPFVLVYILLPIVLFAALWLCPVVGIPVALLAVVAGILAVRLSFLDRFSWFSSYLLRVAGESKLTAAGVPSSQTGLLCSEKYGR